jgi:hypothetical protein
MPKPKLPITFTATLAVVIVATLARGLLGSVVAGVIISLLILACGSAAVKKSRRSTRYFAVGLGLYGAAFVLQACLLTFYVGSRSVDIAWGTVLCLAAVFIGLSKSLSAYFEQLHALSSASAAAQELDGNVRRL